ncbi:SWIM zinc finger domain-containing protein [Bacillus salitolerans]|uniref:SWIM zinc finger domain-containing protein n=1 Tax=Bacillus salitolerans TaxID=1437434 RepID=A0ABW4LSB0_9BACI
MKLSNFEEYIDDTILKRGKDYFVKGRVEDVTVVSHGHYSGHVVGTEDYRVDVVVSDEGNIMDSYCDCPYNMSEFCKHQVAVFYTLSHSDLNIPETKKSQKGNNKVKLQDILKGLKKEELVEILVKFTEDDSNLEKQLIMKYGPVEDEVKASKKIIKENINRAKKRGFIEWNKAAQAVKGAEIVLDKAYTHLENHHPKLSVQLATIILSEVVPMIQFCDDSSGHVGDVIHGSLRLITDATEQGRLLPLSDQEELFQTIMKEAKHPRYNGWSEWSYTLVEACVSLCDDSKLRKKLEVEVQKMLDDIKEEDSWNAHYEKEELMLIQLKILEQYYLPEQVDEFIMNNISNHKFREKAILMLFERKRYEDIITLCLEGEEKDAEYRGIVHKWMEYRYQAYEKQEDIEQQRKLGKALLLKGVFNYYQKIKVLYSENEWREELTDILTIFEETNPSETYVKILIEEKLTEKLLTYCNRKLYEIERLYPYIAKDYPSQVIKLFNDYIQQYSERSTNRSEYKKVCKVIKTFKKACGSEPAGQLIAELQETYVRRPAFLDELRKVK